MARMAKNNDAMVEAVNRMAAAQEEANKLLAQSIELHTKSFELNSKQYTLNIDNHKYNLERDDLAAQYKAGVEEAMDEARKYIDEQYNNLWKMTQQQISLLLSSFHRLENEVAEEKEEVKKSLASRLSKAIKGKGLV